MTAGNDNNPRQLQNGEDRNLISLEKYFDARLVSHNELNEARFKAITDANRKADEIMDLRLATMNEFRETMRDQAAHFVTLDRIEVTLSTISERFGRLEERVGDMEKKQANLDGRFAAYGISLTIIFTVISTIVAVTSRFIK